MPFPNKERRKEMYERFDKEFRAADDYRKFFVDNEWEPALKEWELYKDPAKLAAAKAKERSFIVPPKLYEQVQTKLPRLVRTFFARRPWTQAIDPTGQDVDGPRQAAMLVQYQMERQSLPVTFEMWAREAVLLGTGAAMVPWTRVQRTVVHPVPLTEYLQKRGKVGKEIENIVRPAVEAALGAPLPDGASLDEVVTLLPRAAIDAISVPLREPVVFEEYPELLLLDMYDVWLDPKATHYDLERGRHRFVIRRFWRTVEELEAANKDRKERGLQPLYVLDDLKETYGNTWSTDSGAARRAALLGWTMPQMDDKALEIHEVWRDDGTVEAWANRETLISYRENEFWDGRLPFAIMVNEPRSFCPYGRGLYAIVKDLLDWQRVIINTRIDNVKLATDPPAAVKADRLMNPESIMDGLRPSALIELESGVDANESVNQIIEFVRPPFEMTQTAYQESAQVEAEIESTTGLTKALQGEPIRSGRTTYSETASLINEGNARLELDIGRLAVDMARLSDIFHWRNLQYMPEKLVISQTTDRGQLVTTDVFREQIAKPFKFLWVAPSLEPLANKQAQAQQLIQFLSNAPNLVQLAQAGGINLASLVDWPAIIRILLEKLEIQEASVIVRDETPEEQFMRLLNQPENLQLLAQVMPQVHQAIQQMQGGQGQPGAPPQQGGEEPLPPSAEEEAHAENEAMFAGQPAQVLPEQDHEMHLQIHAQGMEFAQQNGVPPDVLQAMQAHMQEHQAAMGGM